jgi:hypothetical protein
LTDRRWGLIIAERERERYRKVQAGRAAPEPKMGVWLNPLLLRTLLDYLQVINRKAAILMTETDMERQF